MLSCNKTAKYAIGHKEIFQEHDNITFGTIGNNIVLQGYVNGRSIRILFDTGGMTMMSSDFARKLGLALQQKSLGINEREQESQQAMFSLVKLLELGKSEFRNFYVQVSKLNQPFFECYNIDMILGADVLDNLVCIVDFESKVLSMSEDVSHLLGTEMSFEKNEWGSPMVDVVLNEQDTISMLVDLGASYGFDFNSSEHTFLKSIPEKKFEFNLRKKSDHFELEKIIYSSVDSLAFSSLD